MKGAGARLRADANDGIREVEAEIEARSFFRDAKPIVCKEVEAVARHIPLKKGGTRAPHMKPSVYTPGPHPQRHTDTQAISRSLQPNSSTRLQKGASGGSKTLFDRRGNMQRDNGKPQRIPRGRKLCSNDCCGLMWPLLQMIWRLLGAGFLQEDVFGQHCASSGTVRLTRYAVAGQEEQEPAASEKA
ncbi:hypothetical protein cyc_03536 [Cyclospora cayetanensis]|uniref:Uncharacterized protein n=1 Tax=Cyclospora cayetanensis TaxID=88456 RepID=A0A1D3CX29_9EIME|nr:hypothetical protein cyc_03536 [Cyclospora cayetanensis]